MATKKSQRKIIDPDTDPRYAAILVAFLFLKGNPVWVRGFWLSRTSPWTFRRLLKNPDDNGRWIALMCTHFARQGYLLRREVQKKEPEYRHFKNRHPGLPDKPITMHTEYALSERGIHWLLSRANMEYLPTAKELPNQYVGNRVAQPADRDNDFCAVAGMPVIDHGGTRDGNRYRFSESSELQYRRRRW